MNEKQENLLPICNKIQSIQHLLVLVQAWVRVGPTVGPGWTLLSKTCHNAIRICPIFNLIFQIHRVYVDALVQQKNFINWTGIGSVPGLGPTGSECRSRFGPSYRVCRSSTKICPIFVLIAQIDRGEPLWTIRNQARIDWTGSDVGPGPGPEVGPTGGPEF